MKRCLPHKFVFFPSSHGGLIIPEAATRIGIVLPKWLLLLRHRWNSRVIRFVAEGLLRCSLIMSFLFPPTYRLAPRWRCVPAHPPRPFVHYAAPALFCQLWDDRNGFGPVRGPGLTVKFSSLRVVFVWKLLARPAWFELMLRAILWY